MAKLSELLKDRPVIHMDFYPVAESDLVEIIDGKTYMNGVLVKDKIKSK